MLIRLLAILLLSLAAVACYNPLKDRHKEPPLPIPMGIRNEDIPIEFKLSNQLFAVDDWAELHDPRITPKRFQGIYLRMIWQEEVPHFGWFDNKKVVEKTEYQDIEHLPAMQVVVSAGQVAVFDPLAKLLKLATIKAVGASEKGLQAHIVVYVR